jgi:hypothetical protein
VCSDEVLSYRLFGDSNGRVVLSECPVDDESKRLGPQVVMRKLGA